MSEIDSSRKEETISGALLVEGWALSQLYPEDGISSVQLYLDNLGDPGCEHGLAERGFWRPEVTPFMCWPKESWARTTGRFKCR
jgi:hypothetical protein